MAPSLGTIDLVLSPVEDSAADIERAIESFAHVPNGGLVVLPDISTLFHARGPSHGGKAVMQSRDSHDRVGP